MLVYFPILCIILQGIVTRGSVLPAATSIRGSMPYVPSSRCGAHRTSVMNELSMDRFDKNELKRTPSQQNAVKDIVDVVVIGEPMFQMYCMLA